MKKVFLITALLFSIYSFAQDDDDDIVILSAKQNFEQGNYVTALEQYLVQFDEKPDHFDLAYRIGVCYTKTNIDKSKAIPYFEKYLANGKVDDKDIYEIGIAYHLTNDFTNAIKYYNQFLGTVKDADSRKYVERRIEMVNNAIELMKFPVNVTFENMGEDINTKYADYNPFLPVDQSFIVFTTKRYGSTGSLIDYDGYYTPDLFWAKLKNGKYYRPKSMGATINSELLEVAIGISVDGTKLFYNADNYKASGNGDVWFTELNSRGRSFSIGQSLGPNINGKESYESGATLSSDGQILIFSSEIEGGYGGTDLYYSRQLPGGEWSLGINLGPTINTEFDDSNPQLSFDETTLYFASEGHTSIGGFDIFKATWDVESNKASNVQNLGYPVNTTDDNMTYCPTDIDKFAYLSALRPEGLGDLDLYKITFAEADNKYSIVTGELIDTDSTHTNNILAFITVTNTETEEVVGTYDITEAKNSKFVMALPPGKYEAMVEADTYKMKLEKINVFDKTAFRPIIKTNIQLISTLPPIIDTTQLEAVQLERAETNEPSIKKAETTSLSSYKQDKVVYKVQIEKTNPTISTLYGMRLKELGVEKEILKGITVYTKGNFVNSYDAIKSSRALKAKGFKIAFPIAILNGEKIPLQKGIDFQKAQAQNR